MTRREASWLELYMQYTAMHEAPQQFHLWTALAVLSGAVRRNIWLDRGYYQLFPNLYIILVAESAMLRKSTAARIGVRDFLTQVEDVKIVYEHITMEGLVDNMNRKPSSTAFVFAPELDVFLGGDATMSKKMIGFLTTMYDCPNEWEDTTRTHKTKMLKNAAITLLGATTPEGLCHFPQDSVGGGFSSRLMLVSGTQRRQHNPWPESQMPPEELKTRVGTVLKEIAGTEGVFSVTDDARRFYADWYRSIKEPSDPRMASFVERVHDHALRLAMLLSVSERSDLVMEDFHIAKAVDHLGDMIQFMPRALAHVGTTEHSRDASRIITQLRKADGRSMIHGELLSLNSWRMSAEEFRKVMQTLIERGTVDVTRKGKGMLYVLRREG